MESSLAGRSSSSSAKLAALGKVPDARQGGQGAEQPPSVAHVATARALVRAPVVILAEQLAQPLRVGAEVRQRGLPQPASARRGRDGVPRRSPAMPWLLPSELTTRVWQLAHERRERARPLEAGERREAVVDDDPAHALRGPDHEVDEPVVGRPAAVGIVGVDHYDGVRRVAADGRVEDVEVEPEVVLGSEAVDDEARGRTRSKPRRSAG
ncbi:MAG TPA: hypothetical protein VN213_06195 [Solirubrobacteraceae bacterium]|nr:hypothetical protein [Solirubrobacteraceae bacterium]